MRACRRLFAKLSTIFTGVGFGVVARLCQESWMLTLTGEGSEDQIAGIRGILAVCLLLALGFHFLSLPPEWERIADEDRR